MNIAKKYSEDKKLYDLARSIKLPMKDVPAVISAGVLLEELFGENSKLFFIRDCYKTFYEIAREIGQCRIVLSGTPGIGKVSLFYTLLYAK